MYMFIAVEDFRVLWQIFAATVGLSIGIRNELVPSL
jgi:hypothetical protein